MNSDNFEFIENNDNDAKEELNSEIAETVTSDEFINSLPEWDLVPPYDLVRRVDRQ